MFTGFGTLANVALVLVGGALGLVVKKGLKDDLQHTLMNALGVAVMFIGISGGMTGLLTVGKGKLETGGAMLMVISLVIGTLLGSWLKLDDRMNSLAAWTKRVVRVKDESNRFVEGMVNATLVMSVGAMAIMGSLQDGLHQDPSVLITKGILDCVIAMIFASTMGIGVLFSVIPMGLYQGAITLLAQVVQPYLSDRLTLQLSYIGSVLIFVVGFNLVFSDRKMKVANMLPALLIPVAWECIQLVL